MKIRLPLIAALSTALFLVSAHAAPVNEIIVEALVDDNSEFHVRADTIWWECPSTKVGQWQKQDQPTYINGTAWKPRWRGPKDGRDKSYPYSVSLDTTELEFELLAVTRQRGETGIEPRTPITAKVEGGHFVVRILDPEGEARWYKFAVRKKKK